MRRHMFVLFSGAALSVPLVASAQDIGGVFDMGAMTATASMDPVIEQSRQMAIGKGEGDPLLGRGNSLSLTRDVAKGFAALDGKMSPPVARANAAKLTYRPSEAVRKANFARFVERSRAQDPDGAAKLAEMFRTNDVMAQADAWMQPYGMSHTNVADAAAVYLTTAWLAVHGSTDDPGKAEIVAVRDQFATAAGSTPGFAGANDTLKQELAEAMIVQALLVGSFAEMAKNDPGLQAKVQAMVAAGAENTFGFDLRRMQLTSHGLQ